MIFIILSLPNFNTKIPSHCFCRFGGSWYTQRKFNLVNDQNHTWCQNSISADWLPSSPAELSFHFSNLISFWISHCLSQDQRIVLLLILSHNQYMAYPSLRNSYNPGNMYTRLLNATLLLFMSSAEASKVNIIVWVPPESRTTGWGLKWLSFIRSWNEEKASEAGKEKTWKDMWWSWPLLNTADCFIFQIIF